ncbi:MAG: transcription antitermination factor NusB [Actinomycetes bacterium]
MNSKPFKRANPSPARLIAFDLVTQVNRGGAFANLRLPELLAESNLEQRDRAFATELSYGTLRMQGKHDYAITKKIDRPFAELDEKVVDILRLGVHQIFEMRVPVHAAVGETVELARAVAGESKASYVNALLRAIASDPDIYTELKIDESVENLEKLAILYSHPKWIISAYFDQLKDWDAVVELLKMNNVPAAPQIVAWPGKSTVAEILETGGSKLPIGTYSVQSDHLPNEYPAIKDKRAGIQDMGSQLVAEIFFGTSDSKSQSWLDLCAGPGGKAALLNNLLTENFPNAKFLANEPSEHRAELVARVVPKSKIISFDGRNSSEFGETFDRILIDAPCSGLGALRRRPEARWRRSINDLKELLPLQRDLIDSAYEMLNVGGVIGFATCSPLLAETKGQVLDAMYRHKDLELLNIADFSPAGEVGVNPDGTLQLWTHLQECDSMFLALLKRTA